jgi:hypothetical protein
LIEMAVKSMETVVEAMESMEMASGALPHPGRVLEQRLLSPKIGLGRQQHCRTLLGEMPTDLGFRSEACYRQRGGVRGWSGPPHHRVARPRGHSRHQVVWLPLAPLRLFFGLRLASGENRNFGLCFVQFQEYFMCNFSETQK